MRRRFLGFKLYGRKPLCETLVVLPPVGIRRSCLACSPYQTSTRPTSTYPTDTHTPYLAIVQTKEFIGHALRIDASGSEFFHAPKHAPLSLDKPPGTHLRSVKEESDASRLQGLKSFLCDDCSFFSCFLYYKGSIHVLLPFYIVSPVCFVFFRPCLAFHHLK